LHVWHEHAAEHTLDELARKIVVDQEDVKIGPLRISESGYLEVPHKNKYGLDYPPVEDEHTVYPGVRK
jgi:hypothetical protein